MQLSARTIPRGKEETAVNSCVSYNSIIVLAAIHYLKFVLDFFC